MKKTQKIAAIRILIDLIKADTVINIDEMNSYALLKAKYNLSKEEEFEANQTTLADAVSILSDMDKNDRVAFYHDCEQIALSDGFCARSEALLISALKYTLCVDYTDTASVISIPQQTFNIATSSVLYVESKCDENVNEFMQSNYRILFKEMQSAGFDYIYIPKIIEHYKATDIELLKQIIEFLAPDFSDENIIHTIDKITSISTSDFCKDILCNKLEIIQFRNTDPSFLIKIGHSFVNEQSYANYLKLEIDYQSVVEDMQNYVDDFVSLLSSDSITISKVEENKGQFLYHGFYKYLLDMFLLKKHIRSRIFIDPYKETIYFPDVDRKLEKLHRREKSLYVLFLYVSTIGGFNFSLPKSTKQLNVYNRRINHLQKMYRLIYGYFGGDNEKAPDLSVPELRRPMFSLLKRSFMQMNNILYNMNDYIINKDNAGMLLINIEQSQVYIYEAQHNSMILFHESELFQKLARLKE